MKRIHLFEFTDQPWYPQIFRRMQTDYLRFAAGLNRGHTILLPLFKKALEGAGTRNIVDLCSGGAGPWGNLLPEFPGYGLGDVSVTLTDKYPDNQYQRWWEENPQPGITYLAESVDAREVPPRLKGMRTLFEGFHHFKPAQAREILADAVENGAPIGVFEASLKGLPGRLFLVLAPLITILTYLLATPWIRPLTFSRILWTYLIPLVPLATSWDGVVSLLRVYSPAELEELISPLHREGYCWEVGCLSTGTPIFEFTYLLGWPVPETENHRG